MQYLAHPFNDNTLRFIVRYPGVLHASALQAAAYHLVMDAPILHASFHPKHKMAAWHVHPDVKADDCFTFIRCENKLTEQTIHESVLPIHPADHRQMHTSLLTNGQESYIILRISHLCVDGSDGKYLLQKLLQAYNLLYSGQTLTDFHLKSGDRAAEQIYRNLDKDTLRPLLTNPMTGIKSLFPFQDDEAGSNCMVTLSIPADVMVSAHQKAKVHNATLNDVLLCACYRAYAAMDQVDENSPVSIMSMMDLRRYLPGHDSPGLANLAGSLPTYLEKVEGAFAHTLALLSAQTRQIKDTPFGGTEGMPLLHGAAKHLPTHFLEHAASHLYKQMSVGFTNLGTLDSALLTAGDLAPSDAFAGSVLKKKPNVQVCASSMNYCCTLTITGEYTKEDERILRTFLCRMKDEITSFIND